MFRSSPRNWHTSSTLISMEFVQASSLSAAASTVARVFQWNAACLRSQPEPVVRLELLCIINVGEPAKRKRDAFPTIYNKVCVRPKPGSGRQCPRIRISQSCPPVNRPGCLIWPKCPFGGNPWGFRVRSHWCIWIWRVICKIQRPGPGVEAGHIPVFYSYTH